MIPRSDDIANAVRSFIRDNVTYREGTESLSESASLLDNKLLDSAGIVELVVFLENRFAIHIAKDEVAPENLETIHRIVSYVRGKLDTAGGKAIPQAC